MTFEQYKIYVPLREIVNGRGTGEVPIQQTQAMVNWMQSHFDYSGDAPWTEYTTFVGSYRVAAFDLTTQQQVRRFTLFLELQGHEWFDSKTELAIWVRQQEREL